MIMIYPAFIQKGGTIGITALSDGNKRDTDIIRLDSGKRQLSLKGYKLLETAHVRSSIKGRSSDGKTRAEEFMKLIKEEEVRWIISAKGGDYLMEMLPFVDFNQISLNPTWIQGYSDNTGITFTVTTNCNMATVYGCNFNDFGMEPWHKAIENNLTILEGNNIVQTSFDFYEDGFYDRITGLESYHTDKEVYWKNITGQEEINLNGRLLGGCLDVLLNLVGTKYDKTACFVEKCKEHGVVWYLESFSLNSEALTRGLWQLREAGWFQNAKGFVFGRPAFYDEQGEISYKEAVLSVLGELEVPVILEADIGHKAPAMTMINGALGFISCKDGKASLRMELR
ncbi:S66 family peptidase [Anaerocolumna sp. MB42-C2]|uniref:S66 family peptidase n=1 Tax=Anaerocolumna sp. MB42-C2 TaxID=3070997 RepID=UPI0027E2050F|nr:S66 peptidase family protein [Anaerocolumna sp. MB42-C2]WMJ89503.1 LD-carboxypeptidase [Anaerocolumna sp. MB42-C2]